MCGLKRKCIWCIMMTSSNGNIFRITGPFVRGIHRSRWIPHTKPVMRSFDVSFDLRLNKRLSEQPWGWWFEPPSWSLWRHRNDGFGQCTHHSVRDEGSKSRDWSLAIVIPVRYHYKIVGFLGHNYLPTSSSGLQLFWRQIGAKPSATTLLSL